MSPCQIPSRYIKPLQRYPFTLFTGILKTRPHRRSRQNRTQPHVRQRLCHAASACMDSRAALLHAALPYVQVCRKRLCGQGFSYLGFLAKLCSAQYMLWPRVCVCVCLCTCVYVTSRSSTKTTECSITQRTPHNSPQTSQNLFKIRMRSPPMGAPNAGGIGRSWRISTNNSLHLEHGLR